MATHEGSKKDATARATKKPLRVLYSRG